MQCCIRDFFWVIWYFVQFSISLWCHHGWYQGENFENLPFWISGNSLFDAFLVHILHVISAVSFIKLVVLVLAEIMSNKALILKGQKILFQSFLIRLGENFLEFYLLLLFFRRKTQRNKTSIRPPLVQMIFIVIFQCLCEYACRLIIGYLLYLIFYILHRNEAVNR